MNLTDKIRDIAGTIQSVDACLSAGGYNHDVACITPQLVAIAKDYLSLLRVLNAIDPESDPKATIEAIRQLPLPAEAREVIRWLLE